MRKKILLKFFIFTRYFLCKIFFFHLSWQINRQTDIQTQISISIGEGKTTNLIHSCRVAKFVTKSVVLVIFPFLFSKNKSTQTFKKRQVSAHYSKNHLFVVISICQGLNVLPYWSYKTVVVRSFLYSRCRYILDL